MFESPQRRLQFTKHDIQLSENQIYRNTLQKESKTKNLAKVERQGIENIANEKAEVKAIDTFESV